jgi:hypothetical protein
MGANSWQDLSLADQVALLKGLSERSGPDDRFSVRWTGFLTAPSTGSYLLTPHLNDFFSGDLRVWLDDQLVLDSAQPANPDDPAAGYLNTPFEFTANEPVALRAEFLRHSDAVRPQFIDELTQAQPIAALLWQSGQGTAELIPPASYSPPADFASDQTSEQTTDEDTDQAAASVYGLRADYFADSELKDPQFTRLESGVDLLSRVPLTTDHWSEYTRVRDHIHQRMNSPEYQAEISGANAAVFWNRLEHLGAIEHGGVWQRAQIADWMLAHPEVPAAAPGIFSYYFSRAAMLPGRRRIELIRAWSKDRQPQVCQVRFYPDKFIRENLADVSWVGHWLQAPFEEDLKEIVANDLVRPGGHCRIVLAAAAAVGAVQGGRAHWLRQQVAKHLEDPNLDGDTRASWLMAMALVEEGLTGEPPRPHRTFDYLTEAMLVAQSDEMRFRILGQHAPRLLSLGMFTEGRALLDQWADRFTLPEQQAQIGQWRADADTLEAELPLHIARLRNESEIHRQANRIAILQRRLGRAQERGDTKLVTRYQAMIQQHVEASSTTTQE